MGHYASESGYYNTDSYKIQEMERKAWRDAGFSTVYFSHKDMLSCNHCSAVVVDWRKHREVCAFKG